LTTSTTLDEKKMGNHSLERLPILLLRRLSPVFPPAAAHVVPSHRASGGPREPGTVFWHHCLFSSPGYRRGAVKNREKSDSKEEQIEFFVALLPRLPAVCDGDRNVARAQSGC
jgi:hypothetical protein